MEQSPYKDISVTDALSKLQSNKEMGLSISEAKKRLESSGPNALTEKKVSAFKKLLLYFWGPIPIMLIAYDYMEVPERPLNWRMSEVFTVAVVLAAVGVISTFGLYWIGTKVWHMPYDASRTLALMVILCGGNLTIYLMQNQRWVLSKPLPQWGFLTATLCSQIAGTLMSVYGLGTESFIGIGWKYVGLSWLYIGVWFILLIIVKHLLYKGLFHESVLHKTRKL